jgi:hypothetical protein
MLCTLTSVLALLGRWGVSEMTSLLFISVYPLELRELHYGGPYDELQPPFAPEELTGRVGRLVERAASKRPGSGTPALFGADRQSCTGADSAGRE